MKIDWYEVPLGKWPCLQHKTGSTGCGIIVDMVDTHEHLVRLGYSHTSYILQTDFGNTLTLTEEEVRASYFLIKVEEDPLGRLERQKELLKSAYEKYYTELIK